MLVYEVCVGPMLCSGIRIYESRVTCMCLMADNYCVHANRQNRIFINPMGLWGEGWEEADNY